jgi:hypothetical protein
VKSLRAWLLILLAFALPLRGAMAAAMLCAPAAGHVHAAAHSGHAHDHASHGVEASAHAHADHDHAAGDKCSYCASCCSATAPASITFSLPSAAPVAAEFPDPPAPNAEFFSGGQERPPRSI